MVAQLGLSNIERLQTPYDIRERHGVGLSDHEVAFALLMQNARELAEFNADQELAQRLAVDRGGEAGPAHRPATVVQQAHAVEGGEPEPVPGRPHAESTMTKVQTQVNKPATNITSRIHTLLDSFHLTSIWRGQTRPNPVQAPTITTSRTRVPPRATGHACVICRDPIFGEEVQTPCGHFYDIGCIINLFQSALRDELLYPPRCCHLNIPLLRVRPHLTQVVLAEFELKAQEFGTLKRVYCVESTCSRFLGPLHEGNSSKAFKCPSPKCTTTTCGKCRGRYRRFTHFCNLDAETEGVLTLSRASGWSRCPGCAQVVELSTGCYHMTCRCKTEFCYLCRARWKTCKCRRS